MTNKQREIYRIARNFESDILDLLKHDKGVIYYGRLESEIFLRHESQITDYLRSRDKIK